MKTTVGFELEESLKNDSLVLSIASGNSMFPFIKNGMKILLSKPKDINILDTVLFKDGDHYILHRVIDINENGYITMGDNTINREYVKKGSILGVLVGYYKGNKYIEINKELNNKYYGFSTKIKPFIRIKNRIKSVF